MTNDAKGERLAVVMFNPPHPGLMLRDDVLPELGLTVTQAAQQLGVSRVALSRVLNGRAAISPEMALRLEAWLGQERGGRAGLWLDMQTAHDLWKCRTGRVLQLPTPAEDAAITTAAQVDPDARPLTDAEWEQVRPQLRRGRPPGSGSKTQVTLRIDSAVLEAFRATGAGWQTRINEVLKSWVKHRR